MNILEFESYIGSDLQIVIPNSIRKQLKSGDVIHVSVQSERKIYNKSYDNMKDFWETYELDDWNGE